MVVRRADCTPKIGSTPWPRSPMSPPCNRFVIAMFTGRHRSVIRLFSFCFRPFRVAGPRPEFMEELQGVMGATPPNARRRFCGSRAVTDLFFIQYFNVWWFTFRSAATALTHRWPRENTFTRACSTNASGYFDVIVVSLCKSIQETTTNFATFSASYAVPLRGHEHSVANAKGVAQKTPERQSDTGGNLCRASSCRLAAPGPAPDSLRGVARSLKFLPTKGDLPD